MTFSWRPLAMALAAVGVGCGSRTSLAVPIGGDSADASDGEAATCPNSPSTPTRISTLDVALYYQPVTLVVFGPYAYVGLWDGDSGGEVARVSLADGHMDVLASTYDYSPLVAAHGHLFFSPATHLTPEVTAHTVLTSIDLTSLQSNDIPAPKAPPGQYFVNGYATTPRGLMWLEAAESMGGDPQATFLEQWDGSRSETVAAFSQFGSDVVVGTEDAFVLGGNAEGEGFRDEGLYRVPLSGAAATQMKSFVSYESPMLIGTIGNDVIYTPDRLAIVRTTSAGDTTLAMNANLDTCESGTPFCQHRRVWLDETWLYYVVGTSIERVDLATQTSGTFVEDMDHPPTTVTADACNLYWTESNQTEPPSLYEMRR
jgi:hypothetical protein